MDVNAVNQATQTINTGIGSLASSYETFLSLLTTQLKNQDPLAPMDNNEFTQQLTAMTGVQQQLLTNQLLTQMISQDQAALGSSAIGLIGKTVTVETNDALLTQDGASWTYDLAGAAADTKLEVLDQNGKVVWTGVAADNAKGEHTFAWDGRSLSGIAQPVDQTYTLRITATDQAGKAILATGHLTGVATRLQSLNGSTYLTVGGIKAPLSAITAVEALTVQDQAA